MPATIPTTEPRSIRAGDTARWTRTLADYPASAWTLTYSAWNATDAFEIIANADGEVHSVEVAPATTAIYASGRYDWTARVSDGTNIYTVGSGAMQVLPAVGAAMDTRSHARKVLDALNAMIEGRASDGDIDVVRTSIGDNETHFDLRTLIKLRQQYSAAVAQEEAALAVARGDNSGRHIRVRFVS